MNGSLFTDLNIAKRVNVFRIYSLSNSSRRSTKFSDKVSFKSLIFNTYFSMSMFYDNSFLCFNYFPLSKI